MFAFFSSFFPASWLEMAVLAMGVGRRRGSGSGLARVDGLRPSRESCVSPEGEEYEVAEGEYYHEQEEASAPSWLYIVDGCNVVE